MKTTIFILTATFFATVLSAEDAAPARFAVVELFTSEGCSSCPPAEQVLNRIAEDALEDDRPIYTLAFHVDYWNRLGWTDPYSDAAYSQRQRQYAQAFRSRQIYTPQMIVNGEVEFVGSYERKAHRAIDHALELFAESAVTLSTETDEGKIIVKYEVSDAPDGAVLQIALTESDLVSRVERGENAGRTLHHAGVVRVFSTVDLADADDGQVKLSPPDDLDPQNATVVAYVQDPATMRIFGATAIDPPTEP